MAKSIKIAPNVNEVRVKGRVFSVDFNGMHIELRLNNDVEFDKDDVAQIRAGICQSIALSSYSYQVKVLLENWLNGQCVVTITTIKKQ